MVLIQRKSLKTANQYKKTKNYIPRTAYSQTSILEKNKKEKKRQPRILQRKMEEQISLSPMIYKKKTMISKKMVNFQDICDTGSRSKLREETGIEEMHEFSSLVGPLKCGPSTMSRLPKSYSVFAEPITNNERANSTLNDNSQDVDLSLNNGENNSITLLNNLEANRQSSSFNSILPQHSAGSNKVPNMLNGSELEHSLLGSEKFTTAPVQAHETPAVSIESNSLNYDFREIGVQTDRMHSSERTQNTKINISTQETENVDSSLPNLELCHRYIQIRSNNVYIHNHFYH